MLITDWSGIDNVNWYEYGLNLDKNLEQSVSRLKRKKYNPIPARRVYIPKSETEKRPLGISALEHKIAERGIMWILERIYEQDLWTVHTDFVRRGTVIKP